MIRLHTAPPRSCQSNGQESHAIKEKTTTGDCKRCSDWVVSCQEFSRKLRWIPFLFWLLMSFYWFNISWQKNDWILFQQVLQSAKNNLLLKHSAHALTHTQSYIASIFYSCFFSSFCKLLLILLCLKACLLYSCVCKVFLKTEDWNKAAESFALPGPSSRQALTVDCGSGLSDWPRLSHSGRMIVLSLCSVILLKACSTWSFLRFRLTFLSILSLPSITHCPLPRSHFPGLLLCSIQVFLLLL